MNSLACIREQIVVRQVDGNAAARLARELDIPLAAACLMIGRNLTEPDVCRRFFDPSLHHFHDPFLFTDMEKAVERIMAAIERRSGPSAGVKPRCARRPRAALC